MSIKIVFMGSPEFAVPILTQLYNNFAIVGVVTQPDRPAGRGRILTPCPVKRAALEMGSSIIQPEKLYGNKAALDQISTWQPDVIIVAAYSKVLRREILELPPYGSINVHASLLPRWRGASPIQAAIYHGDEFTGISIMKMDEGLDTGAILSQKMLKIEPKDTSYSLGQKLAEVGSELLIDTLPKYIASKLLPVEQGDRDATYAPLLKKADGKLNFMQTAEALERMVRAYNPWPGCYTYLDDKALKIHAVEKSAQEGAVPGKMNIIDGFPAAGTKSGWLLLSAVQPAGKKKMDGKTFLMGYRKWDHFFDGYESHSG